MRKLPDKILEYSKRLSYVKIRNSGGGGGERFKHTIMKVMFFMLLF